MLIEKELRISKNYSKENYYRLNLSLSSSSAKWDNAVEILKDRINGRYFEPIEKLTTVDSVENGFLIMSVLCLLVDTFMQFENGFANSKDDTGNKYISFMRDSLKFAPLKAERFYYDIRNGLLHSAETKNGAYLIPYNFSSYPDNYFDFVDVNDSEAIRIDKVKRRHVLVVSVPGMYKVLRDYFEKYCDTLLNPIDGKGKELRKNFILKMDFITLNDEDINNDFKNWAILFQNVGERLFLDGSPFWYEKDYTKSALLVKSHERPVIEIPFLDIKKFLNGRLDVRNLKYIRCITKSCRPKVLQSTQIRQRNIDR